MPEEVLLCRGEQHGRRVSCRQLQELQQANMAMEEDLARQAASAESGAQLVADQHRFLEEKHKVGGGLRVKVRVG